MKIHSRKTTMAIIAGVLILAFAGAPLVAEGVTHVKLIGSTIPELKMEAGYAFTVDMLQGEGMLTQNNNLKVKSTLGVSPISSTLTVDAVLTPVAVAELSLGGTVGTGWYFSLLDKDGILTGPSGSLAADPLGGAYLKGKAGAALQFDTGAVFEGDWKSVLLRTYQEISYQAYTGAASGEVWDFEGMGERSDSLEYKAEYVVGYRMPLVVNLVAVMVEAEKRGLSLTTPADTTVVLGFPMNVHLPWNLDITVIPQWNVAGPVTGFKRVAAMVNYTF